MRYAIANYVECKRQHVLPGFLLGFAISHNPWQRRNLPDPAAVFFAIYLDHSARYVAIRQRDINHTVPSVASQRRDRPGYAGNGEAWRSRNRPARPRIPPATPQTSEVCKRLFGLARSAAFVRIVPHGTGRAIPRRRAKKAPSLTAGGEFAIGVLRTMNPRRDAARSAGRDQGTADKEKAPRFASAWGESSPLGPSSSPRRLRCSPSSSGSSRRVSERGGELEAFENREMRQLLLCG
jgi:hypothetical protein